MQVLGVVSGIIGGVFDIKDAIDFNKEEKETLEKVNNYFDNII